MLTIRKEIYLLYGGKCAYCGSELDDKWQIDHKIPKKLYEWKITTGNPNDINNLAPACKICNHYKRCMPVESTGIYIGYREYMLKFHLRLSKLPKKTQIPRTEKRIEYMWTIANKYGITPQTPFSGIFYMDNFNPKNKE